MDDDNVDEAVLGFLETHPSAAATLDSITEWWLERRRVVIAVETVTSALVRLIDQGVVEEFRRDDGAPPLFRLASRHF